MASARACSRGASTSPRTWCGWRGSPSPRWAAATGPTRGSSASNKGALRLEVPVVPRHVPLQPIPQVARLPDGVALSRIDHELRGDAHTAQRLVHLLRVEEWHVEVLVAAQAQGRRDDPVGVQEWERQLEPDVGVAPLDAELPFAFPHVLIGPVAGQDVR